MTEVHPRANLNASLGRRAVWSGTRNVIRSPVRWGARTRYES